MTEHQLEFFRAAGNIVQDAIEDHERRLHGSVRNGPPSDPQPTQPCNTMQGSPEAPRFLAAFRRAVADAIEQHEQYRHGGRS